MRTLARALVVLAALGDPAEAAQHPCGGVEAAVARLDPATLGPDARLALAHLAREEDLPRLLAAAARRPGPEAWLDYLVLGFSRHAAALKLLRAQPVPDPAHRLPRALALLALGDASETGTVAHALRAGAPEVRLRTAEALGRMRQVRPRLMLYEALEDPEPAVRVAAAQVLVGHGSRRARRALVDVLRDGPAELQPGAAAALFAHRLPLSAAEEARLPPALRGQAVVRGYLGARRRDPRSLRLPLASREPQERAGAMAALAAAGGTSPAMLAKLTKASEAALGPVVAAERVATLALEGEAEGLAGLAGLDAAGARAAVAVLWAFSAARAPFHRLEAEHAAVWARVGAQWAAQGYLTPEDEGALVRALHRGDPGAGLTLARDRLGRAAGPARWAVAEVLAEGGDPRDVERLVERGVGRDGVPYLVGAARVCRR
jgi:HEAT repeat protein